VRFGIPVRVSENDKRKQRADRFGIVTENDKKQKRLERFNLGRPTGSGLLAEESIRSRAARFGLPVGGNKESTPLSSEDTEKRKRRADRFGTEPESDKKRRRLERFAKK